MLAGVTLVLTIWLPMLDGGSDRARHRSASAETFFEDVAAALVVRTAGAGRDRHHVGRSSSVWAILVTALARWLLGPSPAARLAALEERNEQLLERTRIARELHDSIGHALTIAVMQAGAARRRTILPSPTGR